MDPVLLQLLSEGFYLTFMLIAPIVLVSLVVGTLFSVFQSVTQIQEQTLSFVPKLFAVGFTLLWIGEWMQSELVHFTKRVWDALQGVAL